MSYEQTIIKILFETKLHNRKNLSSRFSQIVTGNNAVDISVNDLMTRSFIETLFTSIVALVGL